MGRITPAVTCTFAQIWWAVNDELIIISTLSLVRNEHQVLPFRFTQFRSTFHFVIHIPLLQYVAAGNLIMRSI